MIRPFIILLCLWAGTLFAQQKYELREYTGKIVSFQPFWEFVYQRMFVEINGSVKFYNFPPEHGQFLLNNFKPGQQITLRVNVNLNTPLNRDLIPVEIRDYFFRDNIVAVLVNNEWVEIPKIESIEDREVRMVLDSEIIDIYTDGGFKTGFIFGNGVAGYKYYSHSKRGDNNDLNKGDRASFIGYKMKIKDGYVLPIPGINEVVFFRRLYKREGNIKSLLYKQNSLCIGVVISSNGENIRTSFPSNYGSRIKEMAERGDKVTIYFDDYKVEGSQQPPELHAMIQKKDSVKILEYGFYGGADIFHQYKATEFTGKITAVNQLPSGVIESVIVNDDSYVEISFGAQKQLRNLLKKGRAISVAGNERIKAVGEIYNSDFRIVTPDKLVLDGKTFIVKDL